MMKLKKAIGLDYQEWSTNEDEFNDDDFDKLFDWFQKMPNFTDEQWDLIFKKQWKELFKTL